MVDCPIFFCLSQNDIECIQHDQAQLHDHVHVEILSSISRIKEKKS